MTNSTKKTSISNYSTTQLTVMASLKQIKKWKPAYQFIPAYTNKKKKKNLKYTKENLNAEGILTVIFSSIPFED